MRMKVRLEIDSSLQEPEVVIKTPKDDATVQHLKNLLEKSTTADTIKCYQDKTEYFLKLDSILLLKLQTGDYKYIQQTIFTRVQSISTN